MWVPEDIKNMKCPFTVGQVYEVWTKDRYSFFNTEDFTGRFVKEHDHYYEFKCKNYTECITKINVATRKYRITHKVRHRKEEFDIAI